MKPIKRRRQRGTVLMEFALTLPLLVLIIMVVLEGSSLVRTHQVLNNAAREGARLAVQTPGITSSDVSTEVVAYASQNGVTVPAGNVTYNGGFFIPTPSGISISATKVTVTYTYTMHYLGVFAWLGVPSTYPLTGQAVFRNFATTTT